MKKFIKRRLPVLMMVLVMVISFSLPAFAASEGWTSAVFNSYSTTLTSLVGGNKLTGNKSPNGNGMEWILPASYPWHGDVVDFYVRANMSVSLKTGDTFEIEEKLISGWFGGSENYIISIRYILGYEYSYVNNSGTTMYAVKFLRNGSWQRYEFQGGASYVLTLPSEKFDITQDADNCFIGIEFKCERYSGVENTFSLNNFNFHYGYGNPNSAEYAGFNKVNPNSAVNLENAENQLKNDTISGVNKAYNSFSAFVYNLQPYLKSITVVTSVMNKAMTSMPFVGHLLNISLGIGLFAFVVGLAGSIISAADRKASREKWRSRDG